MSISLNHSKCFGSADPFDCGQIDTCLYEMSYGSMSQSVAHNLFWIQAGFNDRADEGLTHVNCVPVTAANRRKQPGCARRKRFDVSRQEVGEIG